MLDQYLTIGYKRIYTNVFIETFHKYNKEIAFDLYLIYNQQIQVGCTPLSITCDYVKTLIIMSVKESICDTDFHLYLYFYIDLYKTREFQ